jgi:uncharacterized membrane protein YkoI
MFRYIKISLVALAITATGSAAYAAKAAENDAMAIGKAKISLTQAIAAAEQHANGKAVRAEFEPSRQHSWVYDVEVVSGAKVLDVKVDADKGTIISSKEDKSDHDGDHNKKD